VKAGPAAVVVSRAPADGVAAFLLARTLAWARAAAPGADYLAGPEGVAVAGPEEFAVAGPEEVGLAAGRLPSDAPPPERRFAIQGDPLGDGALSASDRAFAAGHAPVLLATAGCPALSAAHAAAALDDLRNGCDLAIGPLMFGGWYLLGLARPLSEIGDFPAESWKSPDVTAVAVAAAQRAGLTIGLLRPERTLATKADRLAALVDPMLPEDLRAVLTSRRG
jgi:hypothetical protein